MDMATVGWITLGWFAVALVVSLTLGGFLRKVNVAPCEDDFAEAAARQKVMRYMRGHKHANARADAADSRDRDRDKRSVG